MKVKEMVLIPLFTALIAVGAYIRVPVPVCPFTLQFLFTTLAGMLLGPKNGTYSVILYVLLGLAGVPVFTGGGGISYVLQPTFGYLLGFCGGTWVTGTLIRRGAPTIWRMAAGAFCGLLVVYAAGMAYYWAISQFWLGTPIGLWPLFLYCFLLAVPGDLALCVVSAGLAHRLLPILHRSTVTGGN